MRKNWLHKAMVISTCGLVVIGILECPKGTLNTYDKSIVYAAEENTEIAREELTATIQNIKTMNFSGYTAPSITMLNAVLANAERLSNDTSAPVIRLQNMKTILEQSVTALRNLQENVVYDGEYSIDGQMWHATQNQVSMGNAAVTKPMKIVKKGESVSLELEFHSLKIGNSTGYLYKLYYFPEWTDKNSIPYTATPTELNVNSYYTDVYDAYNDPNTGIDAQAKGNLYPQYMSMPVAWMDDEVWVQVYVPVMEAISEGSGTQLARLQLNWGTLTQTKGAVTDKSTLDTYVTEVSGIYETMKTDGEKPQEELTMVSAILEAAKAVQADMNATQTDVNNAANILKSVKNLSSAAESTEKVEETEQMIEETKVDKSALHMMLLTASSIVGRDGYTSATIKNLKDAIELAEAVYQNQDAAQETVNKQLNDISMTIIKLERQPVTTTVVTNTGANNSTGSNLAINTENTETKEAKTEDTDASGESLDIKKLKDGTYSIQGSMVKIDKKTASMSNEAINHNIKLTVKKGKYKVSLVFTGLTVNTQKGYLGELKYFKSGYKLDGFGAPNGTLGTATIDSYQKDTSGNKLADSFGTNYPKEVTFPLISEALKDGYVPLQVFVPIMESIATGTGTQPVFLKLDLDSVKSASKNDAAFTETDSDITSTTTTTTTTSNTTLKTTTGVTSQSLPESSSATSGLAKSGMVKSSNTVLPGISTAGTGVQSPVAADMGLSGSTVADSSAQSLTAAQSQTVDQNETGIQSQTVVKDETAIQNQTTTRKKSNPIPVVMSILSVIAGVFYKAKSTKLF